MLVWLVDAIYPTLDRFRGDEDTKELYGEPLVHAPESIHPKKCKISYSLE